MSFGRLASNGSKKLYKCSPCKNTGHNKRSCKNVINRYDFDTDKQHIITMFNKNVKNVEINLNCKNTNHDGKVGHWLETKMNIKHNSRNEPDIGGYEMKKFSSKITLGDFSASEYVFSPKNRRNGINFLNGWTDDTQLNRSQFIKTFGNQNPDKNGRYSWSGSCVPTYDNWNFNGQKLTITENNDIIIYYSFSKDKRQIKTNFPLCSKCRFRL